jgi:hypothetical protein
MIRRGAAADGDRRGVSLTVTEEGLRRVHAWQATNGAVLNLAFSTLTASQRKALAAPPRVWTPSRRSSTGSLTTGATPGTAADGQNGPDRSPSASVSRRFSV